MEIHAKRMGKMYIVYRDPGTDATAAIRSFEDEPAGFLGCTFHGVGELAKEFPGAKFKFFDPPPATNPECKIDEKELNKLAEEAISEGAVKQPEARQPETIASAPVKDVDRADIVHAFEQYCSSPDAWSVEIVGEFLINAFPEIEEQLIEAAAPKPKQPKQRKKFTYATKS